MVHKKKGAADISALVKRVLNHMREHLKDEGVQEFGLEAIIEFASTTTTAALCCRIGPRSASFWPSRRTRKPITCPGKAASPSRRCVANLVCHQSWARRKLISSQTGLRRLQGRSGSAPAGRLGHREHAECTGQYRKDEKANMYTLVQDVVTRLEDRTVAAEQKIALPLPLRAIWTNEQLHSIKLKKMDEKRAIRRDRGEGDAAKAGAVT